MVVKVSPEAASTAFPSMMSLAGLPGASVSVIFECPLLCAVLGAPALDDLGVVTIVGRQSLQHPAERMIGTPDLGGFLRDALELLHEQLAGAVRSEERRVGKECRSRGARYHEKRKR